jgi:malate dehydrogenase
MSISIAIIGATGAVGSALCVHILRSELLEPGDRLQLVGHGEAVSTGRLFAIRTDLLDAFDDQRVIIEVVPDISQADADLVVLTAGVPMSSSLSDRRDLGAANLPIFQNIATACAEYLPNATYIVVSNPVELAVKVLASKIDRKQVLGVGAEQDSLRFARAVARTLGVSRRDVRASVWGEHGRSMVPLWSSVEVRAGSAQVRQSLVELKQRASAEPLVDRVTFLQGRVRELLLEDGELDETYNVVEKALPDATIFVEPFITARTIHSTPNATANAVLNVLRAWKEEDRRRLHAQVLLDGEVNALVGVCGVPIILSARGWELDSCEHLSETEQMSVRSACSAIQVFLDQCVSSSAVA